jgi:23S rRNA (uridine2552-2'-O)-methyltransferase
LARRALHDQYFKQAKAEGYLARSAYKLQQIQESKRILKRGNRVLDLGCAPGAWLQVAAEIVGPEGVVVGVDLQEVRHSIAPNVHTIVGDAYQIEPATLLGDSGALFHVVLSDMAPNTTGHGDDLVSARLCDRVLELLPRILSPGGNLAMKIFEGAEYGRVLRDTQQLFTNVKGFKPKASRDVSREMYIVGTGYAPKV